MTYLETMKGEKRNRLKHWVFWLVYFIVNHVVFAPELFGWTNFLISALFAVHNAGTAYVTIDYWIPRLYKKGQYGLFILAILATVLLFALFLGLSLMAAFHLTSGQSANLENIEQFHAGFFPAIFWSNFSAVTLVTIPYFILQRMELDRRNQQLEKEKLEAELKLLKSQLNPHFLFNALNNIYFLIKKDPDTAAEALAGFSNLLRFQLYEANSAFVPLQKEIDYLQQYAEIAQLRKVDSFKVNWQLPTEIAGIEIAPLLLMPLIENAFKHSSNKNGILEIALTLEKEELHFTIKNTKEAKSIGVDGFEEGGIGLANIRKRLALIYPSKHELTIQEIDTTFNVDLKLLLKK